jgi:uncharacterized protein YjbI with pentapeptide repeats
LSEVDLREAQLFQIDFSNTNLRSARLDRARLISANLLNATLDNSSLFAADLSRATLTDARLTEANLRTATLSGAAMIMADLSRADLVHTTLRETDLSGAQLSGANLANTNLNRALLVRSNLHQASLASSSLTETLFRQTIINQTDFTGAHLYESIFLDVDLSTSIGLDTCKHQGPSSVDHRTLEQSGTLPLQFLRGVGLPDSLIEYLPSLLNRAIQHYSCFISYSARDREFAERIHADLQDAGVRCWFAPHDMPIGGKILDEIDAAIRLRDKVLLILSRDALTSDWVEDEVTKGFEEERRRGSTVLFPIRVDDTILESNEPWAAKLRARHIGDFTDWKNHDIYKKNFARALRDLVVLSGK